MWIWLRLRGLVKFWFCFRRCMQRYKKEGEDLFQLRINAHLIHLSVILLPLNTRWRGNQEWTIQRNCNTQDTIRRQTKQKTQHRKLKRWVTQNPPKTQHRKLKRWVTQNPPKTQHRKLKRWVTRNPPKTQHRKLKRWVTQNPPKNTTQKTKKMSNTEPTKNYNTEN